ncbi:hypothetical protein K450DRAFT_251475 [Umbelopsis ramanniana AG]|uniref:UDP-N-acetylglucosamine diphosphorylase n=1 Tax=Umbelopsis ramanniana AG TaxID=1314678 RepID=A0AAD5HB35_UMBRA|nr:uncharacterized protein K450DRAFT_251475 [Umbelopsis ramanniana AG]KAI8577577.1 hypothetical protein K450DRAFT_251475 [Umbelopsis ramanniana AG]
MVNIGMTQTGFTSADIIRLRASFDASGQGHVFTFWDSLTTEQQQDLYTQLTELDIFRINQIYDTAVKKATDYTSNQAAIAHPLSAGAYESTLTVDSSSLQEWRELGLKLIAEGKVAVIFVAGCKGTRLGSSGPRGYYDINSPSGKTWFQSQAEHIIKLQKMARASNSVQHNVVITWYIITSGRTHDPIYSIFENNNYFGLEKENVLFVKQGILPCLTMEGKILMEDKYKVAVAADSNGGIYHALHNKGVITSLKERGILYSHCYDVDNCLTRAADPTFIGYSVAKNTDCGVKVVATAISKERVDAVEYFPISREVFEIRKTDCTLTFGTANIVNHFFSTEFLERIYTFSHELEYHIARKKIKHINLDSGEFITPELYNGMMLECFIFDVFPFTRNLSVLEVDLNEEFSLLKNIPDFATDCSETSRRDLVTQRLREFQAANGRKVRKDNNENLEVKVSSLVSIWW